MSYTRDNMTCRICGGPLDTDDPGSRDCGGDCLRCMAYVVEDPDSIEEMRRALQERESPPAVRDDSADAIAGFFFLALFVLGLAGLYESWTPHVAGGFDGLLYDLLWVIDWIGPWWSWAAALIGAVGLIGTASLRDQH